MAKLPIYDTPKVAPQVGPSGVMNIQAPNLGGAIGQGISNLGQDIGEIQFRANKERTEAVLNDAIPEIDNLSTQATSVLGEDVLKPDADGRDFVNIWNDKFNDLKAKKLEGIKDPSQKKMIESELDRYGSRFLVGVQRHEVEQIKRNSLNIAKGQISTEQASIQTALKNGTFSPAVFEASVPRAIDGAEQSARLQGVNDPASLKTIKAAALSDLHETALKGFVASQDFTGAKQWLDDHKDQVSGDVWNKYSPAVNKASVATKAQRLADLVESEKPKDADKRIRELAGEDKDLRDAARDELATRATLRDHADVKAGQEYHGQIQTQAQSSPGSINALIAKTRANFDISDRQRGATITWLESVKKAAQDDTPESRTMRRLKADELMLSPEFANISREGLRAELPKYGYENIDRVLAAHALATGDGAVKPPDAMTLDVLKFSLFGNKKKLSETETAELNYSLIAAKTEFEKERTGTGKGKAAMAPPTADQWLARTKFYFRPRVTKPGIFSDDKTKMFAASEDDMVNIRASWDENKRNLTNSVLRWNGVTNPTQTEIIRKYDELELLKERRPKEYDALMAAANPAPVRTRMTKIEGR